MSDSIPPIPMGGGIGPKTPALIVDASTSASRPAAAPPVDAHPAFQSPTLGVINLTPPLVRSPDGGDILQRESVMFERLADVVTDMTREKMNPVIMGINKRLTAIERVRGEEDSVGGIDGAELTSVRGFSSTIKKLVDAVHAIASVLDLDVGDILLGAPGDVGMGDDRGDPKQYRAMGDDRGDPKQYRAMGDDRLDLKQYRAMGDDRRDPKQYRAMGDDRRNSGKYRAMGESGRENAQQARSEQQPRWANDGVIREIEWRRGGDGDGGGAWSGRVWVGGKLYVFTESEMNAARWVRVKITPTDVVVSVESSGFDVQSFPGDEEWYDLAYTYGDIHCDRF